MSMEILSRGTGEFRFTGPDVIRGGKRDHKRQDFAEKTCQESDGVSIGPGHRNLQRRPEFPLGQTLIRRTAKS